MPYTARTMNQIVHLVTVLFVLWGFLNLKVECRRDRIRASFRYMAPNCRAHSASITEFGGVGDGITVNTKAFHAAIDSLSQFGSDGGSQLYIPPGKWLTGSFNLTSNFTLYLDKDAVILGSQDMSEWPLIAPLPSYGRGRDEPGGRYSSLIFGTHLTDVVITGDNGTIDGQGALWWSKFHRNQLKNTRGYLVEMMFSDGVIISNLTFINSPSWNIHPVYSSNVIVKGITILAPLNSPNTDGINPDSTDIGPTAQGSPNCLSNRDTIPRNKQLEQEVDFPNRACLCIIWKQFTTLIPASNSLDSCSYALIEDCYIVSGDDCVAIKSGWDEYGIAFGMPSSHITIRRLTCISPTSAVIALGSEMSGGINDVRAEDIVAINSETGVRIKTAIGRGGFVKDIFVRGMTMHTMKWVFGMTGTYGQHPDNNYDPNAIPVVQGISYSNMVAENVSIAGKLEGIPSAPFTGICMSNVTIGMAAKSKKYPWNCTNVEGISSSVSPKPCDSLTDQGSGTGNSSPCPFPTERIPLDNLELQTCYYTRIHA